MSDVLLVGGFLETAELCEEIGLTVRGVVDPSPAAAGPYPYLGSDEDAPRVRREFPGVPVLLTPDIPERRRLLHALYSRLGFGIAMVVSPRAFISPSARLGEGCLVQRFVSISASARLGIGVRINTSGNVMHDVTIGDFATVAPNAVLLGRVRVGAGAYVGANATILPGRHIGAGAVVGAAAVVTRDVPDGATVVGCPARPR